jgi:hypothetical protein
MIGLRTAKALIVDDVPAEALPVIKALGSLGVGTVYHDGDPKADYTVKHTGIRLLLLDMVLANRGATEDDPKATIGTLIGALKDLMDDGPGMVLVVCWTKHPQVKELFSAAFVQAFPRIHLIDVLLFDKRALMAPEESKHLLSRIREALAKYEPADLLLHFEQLAHQSASKTVGLLCDVARRFAEEDISRWPEGMYAICSALALAERGSRLAFESPEIARAALTDAMAPLLADNIEHHEVIGVESFESISKVLLETCKKELALWPDGKSLLTATIRAELNSKLNVSHTVHTGHLCPGTAYVIDRHSDNRKKLNQFLPDLREAVDDTFGGLEGKLPEFSAPMLIEISPPCDFAQARGKVPKFLSGFMVPLSSTEKKRGAHIRSLGPLRFAILDKTERDYEIVFNSHYTVTLKKNVAEELVPAFRIRSAALADLLAWHGALANRPGFLLLSP